MIKFRTQILEFEFEENLLTVKDNYISEEEFNKEKLGILISQLQDIYKQII